MGKDGREMMQGGAKDEARDDGGMGREMTQGWGGKIQGNFGKFCLVCFKNMMGAQVNPKVAASRKTQNPEYKFYKRAILEITSNIETKQI